MVRLASAVVFVSAVAAAAARIPNWRTYPAGVDPLSCPDYPFCTRNPVPSLRAGQGGPVIEILRYPDNHVAAKLCDDYPYCAFKYVVDPARVFPGYPADVAPAQCPNYPYCQ